MAIAINDLDRMQAAYKEAVDLWVAAIRKEELLASGDHTEAEIDDWEAAGFSEEEARQKAKDAKTEYEDALREKFFSF
jgi:predicted RNase H-like HicB family nuclease